MDSQLGATIINRVGAYRFIAVLLFSFAASPVSGETEVTPDDVYAQVMELSVLVERRRYHAGVPKARHLKLVIKDAQPHDVFFQALTLFRKSNRLLFQITRKKAAIPRTQRGVYRPSDVLKLSEGAQQNVSSVLEGLGLTVPMATVPVGRPPKSPSDVFMATQVVNRQINLLLERPFSPSDVHMEVTRAIGYGARQLARFPGVRRIPDASPVEPGRVPSEVFFRLLDCLERIRWIYELEGLSSLSVDADMVHKEDITPSDVFDIASLVVARLDFLHKYKAIEHLPREPFYPGKVFPTDVYRQAGILLSQLNTLIELSGQGKME